VERRIDLSNLDLDRAMEEVERRRPAWEAQGVHFRPATWMDNASDWPRPLLTRRAEVHRPMSLGIHLSKDDDSEAEVVLYAGGWADFMVWVSGGDDVVQAYEELESAQEFGPLLDRHLAPLLGGT
jgi:hypothetical protein